MHRDATARTKCCCACKKELPVEEFSLKIKATGQRQSRCRACQKLVSRAHYEKNRSEVIARSAVQRKARGLSLRETVAQHLAGSRCACGSTQDLTFVVHPGYTGPRVSAVVSAGMAPETLQDSMQNSTVMCTPCMHSAGRAGLADYQRKKAAGEVLPKNPVTKAEYKRRHTRSRVDLRVTEHRAAVAAAT